MGGRIGCRHRSRIPPPTLRPPRRRPMVVARRLAANFFRAKGASEFSATGQRRPCREAPFPRQGHGQLARVRAGAKTSRLQRPRSARARSQFAETQPVTPPPAKPGPDDAARGRWPMIFAGAFGALLGLCLLKFGNPVILEKKIQEEYGGTPSNILEW